MNQLTAPNQTIEAASGVTFAYRRFGNAETAALPLVCCMHFRGNLDNWDPALVDALAEQREVILFDNAGVAGSTGEVPGTFAAMAHDALTFIDALGLTKIDVLGYSIGGYVAQELTLIRPQLVRRLVLAGTAPQGGEDIHGFADEVFGNAVPRRARRRRPARPVLRAQRHEHRQGLGVRPAHLRPDRRSRRRHDAAHPRRAARCAHRVGCARRQQAQPARRHHAAGARRERRQRPHGPDEEQLPPRGTSARRRSSTIYPDAGHGFLFQYPAEFAQEINAFLA